MIPQFVNGARLSLGMWTEELAYLTRFKIIGSLVRIVL